MGFFKPAGTYPEYVPEAYVPPIRFDFEVEEIPEEEEEIVLLLSSEEDKDHGRPDPRECFPQS